MRIFRSSEEVQQAQLPPLQHNAVAEAVRIMERIFGKGFDQKHGFVVLVEAEDTPDDAKSILGYPMADKLETPFRCQNALIALTLWGNSGDGITWICLEVKDYAPLVQDLLRQQM